LCLCSLADEVAANIRRTKQLLLKSRERRRFVQLQLRHHGNKSIRCLQSAENLELVTAARHSSVSTAVALQMQLSPSKQRHSRSSAQRFVLMSSYISCVDSLINFSCISYELKCNCKDYAEIVFEYSDIYVQ